MGKYCCKDLSSEKGSAGDFRACVKGHGLMTK
jgi:hypothetical protein